ncbi:MAG: GyrI-like domain-containing protein [Solobacterium sp.]|jgi:AraC family transcriptional regulator|nr:GyrI-like domain-containing protein [Solobacterium sp.]
MDEELEIAEIPAAEWVIFPVHGTLPESLQKVNSGIWNTWVPEHQKDNSLMLEMYMPPSEDMIQYYCELWVPLQRSNLQL